MKSIGWCIAVSSLVAAGCTAGVEGPSSGEEDGKVAAAAAPLIGNTDGCYSLNTGRMEWTFSKTLTRNMQTHSKDLAPDQRDWWNRTDCPALVVDWVRISKTPRERGGGAWISGIIEPDIINNATREQCDLLSTQEKILAQTAYMAGGQWDTVVDRSKFGCGQDLDTVPWIGNDGPNAKWFDVTLRVRAITQGFAYIFPIPVSAYMQNDTDAACTTQCCHFGNDDGCGDVGG